MLCLKPPWRAKALNLSLNRDLANFSLPYFVFTNTKIEPSLFKICFFISINFSSDFNSITSCLIFFAATFSPPTETRIGLFKYFVDNFLILSGIVAENINVCLLGGTNFKILFIWTSKPISNILSVSSKTKKLVSWRLRVPLSKWSLILPGVPTNILGRLFNCDNCLLINSPPINETVLIGLLKPKREWTTSNTCFASSLVGIIIKADPLLDLRSNSIIGMQKAAVFPVPVCADPKISFPPRTKGIDSACIEVGILKFIFLRDLFNFSFKLNLIKSFIYNFHWFKIKLNKVKYQNLTDSEKW